MDLRAIESFREGDRLEAKAAQCNLPRSLWETYSSFANTSGGLIVLGVEERGRQLHVVGVLNPDKLLEDLWNAVNNPKKVSSNILSERDVEIVRLEGKAVVSIAVPRADRHVRPVFIENNPLTGTYRRNHSGDYRCSYEAVRSMMRDFYFRIYQKLAQALKVPFRLEGISRIDDTPAHKALREALANCLTNADYHGRRGLVALRMPDRIELANPGGFRVDMEAALSGGVSDPRNATMAKIFSFVEIGERAGSGLPKIFDGWKACGLPEPTITESFDPDRTVMVLPLVEEAENRPQKLAAKTGGKNGENNGGEGT